MPQEKFPIEPSPHYNFPLPSDSNHPSFVSTSMPFSIGSIPHITHTISTSPKTLPIVSSVPLLHSDLNFFAWDEAVCTILRFLGLYGHILDASVPLGQQPWSPDLLPAIKPKLSQPPTPSELVALNLWVENDNIAQYIITSRLGSIPHQLLPSAHGCRTALELYVTLSRHFGLRNFFRSSSFADSLLSSTANPRKIMNYVARWRVGVTRLQSVDFPISARVYIHQFVKGLPPSMAFMTLRARLPQRLENMKDDDIAAFISITDEVLDLAAIFPVADENDG